MKTLLKLSVCMIFFFFGKNTFAQTQTPVSIVGKWVYNGPNSIQKLYTDAYDSVNFSDTIVLSEDYNFTNNRLKSDAILSWDYDATENILLIMDMINMEGVEYLIKVLNEKELIFDKGFKYIRIK